MLITPTYIVHIIIHCTYNYKVNKKYIRKPAIEELNFKCSKCNSISNRYFTNDIRFFNYDDG